jgi:hypothetical protein
LRLPTLPFEPSAVHGAFVALGTLAVALGISAGSPRLEPLGRRAMIDPSLDPLLAYLREHSGHYSLSALREQLVQTGYDPAMVDRAIAIYQAPPVPVGPKVLQVLGANAVLALLAILAMFLAGKEMAFIVGIFYSAIFWGELLVAIVLAMERRRGWGSAILFGFLLSIPIWILVLGGLAFSLLEGINRGWH